MRNETILQFIMADFPFGGIGTSGIGSYLGKASFDTFTHKRTSLYHPCHSLFEYGGLRYVSCLNQWLVGCSLHSSLLKLATVDY